MRLNLPCLPFVKRVYFNNFKSLIGNACSTLRPGSSLNTRKIRHIVKRIPVRCIIIAGELNYPRKKIAHAHCRESAIIFTLWPTALNRTEPVCPAMEHTFSITYVQMSTYMLLCMRSMYVATNTLAHLYFVRSDELALKHVKDMETGWCT